MIKALFRLAGMALLLTVGGCATTRMDPYFASVKSAANVYVAPMRVDVTRVAVLPFKGPTELIGASVSDIVVTELLRAGRYTLVERSQMAGVLSEAELAMAGLSESKAVEVAKMLGADGVVIGTVDEYGTQAQGGRALAVAGVAMRLIHCQTGQILWSADLAKMAADSKTPLAAHGRAVVHELIAGLYQKWGVQQQIRAPIGARPPVGRPAPAAPAPPAPPAPPPAPQGLAASDLGLREVTLKWTPPSPPAPIYRVERATSADGPFTRIAEVSSLKGAYTDRAGLKDATAYYYRIVPISAAGVTGAPSAAIESMTAPPPDPPKPVAATATGSRQVTVSWTPPRGEGVVRYAIERAAGDAPDAWTPKGEVTATTWIDGGRPGTDLRDSTRYLYRVRSINRVGAVGEPSAPAAVTTAPPPAMVQDFAALCSQVRCVPLSWKASVEADVVGYELERRDEGSDQFHPLARVAGRTNTVYLDGRRDPGDLKDSTRYMYRIRPFNAVGSFGEWSAELPAVTRPPPPPPTGLTIQGGLPRAVAVAWSPSPDEKVIGYEVERAEGADGAFARIQTMEGAGSTSLVDRAGAPRDAPAGRLKDGTLYRYRVRAFNTARAVSEWSEDVAAATKPAPAAPAGLSATTDRPKSIVVEWRPNSEPDIAQYVVESRAADGTRWRAVGSATEPRKTHGGLEDGEARVYRVKAVDRDTLESAWSEEARGRARPLPPPPTDLAFEWAADGAKVSWKPPREGMREYRVYRKGFLASEKILTVEAPAALLSPAQVGKRLSIAVTAVDEEGLESLPSAALDIRAPAGP